jgi:hypothetical protein
MHPFTRVKLFGLLVVVVKSISDSDSDSLSFMSQLLLSQSLLKFFLSQPLFIARSCECFSMFSLMKSSYDDGDFDESFAMLFDVIPFATGNKIKVKLTI